MAISTYSQKATLIRKELDPTLVLIPPDRAYGMWRAACSKTRVANLGYTDDKPLTTFGSTVEEAVLELWAYATGTYGAWMPELFTQAKNGRWVKRVWNPQDCCWDYA